MKATRILVAVGTLLGAACSGPSTAEVPARARAQAPAQREHTDPLLQAELEELAGAFRGSVGIYVRHLGDGRSAAIRADELFPAAALVQVPILLGLFARLERGELEYRARLEYRATRKHPGEDLLARVQDGAAIELGELCMLMCALGDNTAAQWCQELAGTGTAINAWLEGRGYSATRVNARTPGRQADHEAYGWGQTSPREMAALLIAVRERRAVAPAADEEMERLLSRSTWTGEGLAALPPFVHAMSKQGAVTTSRSEVLLVDGPSGAWVLCVITKDQADRTWGHGNEGFELLRQVSAAVWRRFEPDTSWSPATGGERYH